MATIAVNALSVTTKPSGGRTYLLCLMQALPQMARDRHRFIILCTAPIKAEFEQIVTAPNVEYAVFPALVGRPAARVPFEQFVLPLWLAYRRIGLFFAARNLMPLLAPCPTVIGILSMHLNYEQNALAGWRRRFGQQLLAASARRANAFVSISEYAGVSYIDMYDLPRARLVVTPLGYTRPDGVTAAATPLHDRPYVLFVSTLHAHKNVAFLIDVFAQLAPEFPALDLVVVGRDPAQHIPALQAQAAQLGIGDRVRFTGAVGDKELATWYEHAEVFAFPSLVEGFGLTVLEAMAHAVPVVASDRTSIPEVVGDAGIVADVSDAAAWVDALRGLLLDGERRATLAARGQARAALFTWEETACATLACLDDVLSQHEK